jgi:hypothetical protein
MTRRERAELIEVLRCVAAHFEGTDAPLGVEVRALLARIEGER